MSVFGNAFGAAFGGGAAGGAAPAAAGAAPEEEEDTGAGEVYEVVDESQFRLPTKLTHTGESVKSGEEDDEVFYMT